MSVELFQLMQIWKDFLASHQPIWKYVCCQNHGMFAATTFKKFAKLESGNHCLELHLAPKLGLSQNMVMLQTRLSTDQEGEHRVDLAQTGWTWYRQGMIRTVFKYLLSFPTPAVKLHSGTHLFITWSSCDGVDGAYKCSSVKKSSHSLSSTPDRWQAGIYIGHQTMHA